MPGFDINSFKANFQDGARSYLFYIMLTNPVSTLGTEKTSYLVRTSSVPEDTIEPIEVPWQGTMYKLGSTHTYADWTVTFSIDVNHKLHTDFINWQKMIHDPETNVHGNPTTYMVDQEIWLLNTAGVVTKRMKLVSAWPQTIGEISLDHSSKELQTFDVTFTYLYHITI